MSWGKNDDGGRVERTKGCVRAYAFDNPHRTLFCYEANVVKDGSGVDSWVPCNYCQDAN